MARILFNRQESRRTVVITGGTGTFGMAATAMLRTFLPDWRLRILSRDEYKQVHMAARFGTENISYLLGDVRNIDRLRLAFRGADLVLHAAALKHVPVGEYNPDEVVATNVQGSMNVVRACIDEGIKRCVLLSSDKAVYPINTYGATKLVAERVFIQGNHYSPHNSNGQTDFNVVRYGNVANSRGSVIEIFASAMANGQPLHVTDARMTRFWFTIEEAVALVCYAAEAPFAGCLFVPKIPAFSLIDLCKSLLQKNDDSSGEIENKIVYTGIRLGEKVHEFLMTEEERSVARFCYVRQELHSELGKHGPPYCFVVPPLHQFWQRNHEALRLDEARIARPYESGQWDYRLTVDHMRAHLRRMGIANAA